MRFRKACFSILALVLIAVATAGVIKVLSLTPTRATITLRPSTLFYPTLRSTRSYVMAPVAWQAYLRACQQAKLHPFRVGQTIGDHPLSAGYHKRDGVLHVNGQKVDYCTAVDLGTWGLSPRQINAFQEALVAQGFAAFYRHEGKWKGKEHIHAIYAFLPMKPQLQIQLADFLRERRRSGQRVRWEKKLRRQRRKLRHWML